MSLEDQIPGYAEALAWEQQTREEAFLGVCSPLGGVPVVPLTLRRMTFLLQVRSAYLHGRQPSDADAALFLWIVSPAFAPGDLDARDVFVAALRAGGHLDDLDTLYLAIRDYLDAAFNDAPASKVSAGDNGTPPVASFASAIVDRFAVGGYPWSLAEVMDTPLSILYQQLRRIALRDNPKALFISRRSRKAKGDWQRTMNANLAAASQVAQAHSEKPETETTDPLPPPAEAESVQD